MRAGVNNLVLLIPLHCDIANSVQGGFLFFFLAIIPHDLWDVVGVFLPYRSAWQNPPTKVAGQCGTVSVRVHAGYTRVTIQIRESTVKTNLQAESYNPVLLLL